MTPRCTHSPSGDAARQAAAVAAKLSLPADAVLPPEVSRHIRAGELPRPRIVVVLLIGVDRKLAGFRIANALLDAEFLVPVEVGRRCVLYGQECERKEHH